MERAQQLDLLFHGPAWEMMNTDRYYLHLFSKQRSNWENRNRSEIYDMMKFWLDMG
ncbi:MAG: alpha-amylase family glycosyl hydrolase [Blautia coccoides]